MGIVGLQLCGKTGGVCQNKVGRSSQFRFKTGAVPAPVGFAYDVVAPVIDANRRMDILLQIAAAVNVCIDEVDVIFEVERGSLLYNPSGYAGIVFLLTILKSGAGRKLAENNMKGQSSTHMLALICRSGEVSPLMTAMRRM